MSDPSQLTCRFCGQSPALGATIHEHRGMLLMMQHRSLRGPFCRPHGMRALRDMTGRSLVFGWWGVISLIAGNPFTLIANGITWLRLRGLPAPPNPIST